MNTLSEQNLLICRRLSLWEHLDKCTGYVENRNKQEDQFDRSKTTGNQGRQSLRCPGALEATVRILGVSFLFLEGLVLYFKKTFINFQHQNSYTIGLFFFFFPSWSPKRPHQRREHFKPIKLQDAHLPDLTETSSKKGDWVGKETLKDQHTESPQTVESSHSQRGDQYASTPKKQSSKII